MTDLVQDIRVALRGFRKNPAFTITAILSLAVGIGANTAIFSVANGVLFHQLRYHDADRLVILWNRSPGLGIAEDWFSTAQYFDIVSGHSGFEALAIAIGANYNLTGDGREPERVGCIRVSSSLLPMLGARPLLGRFFAPEDDQPGRAPSAILSHGAWQRRFGGDASVVGKSILLNGNPYQVVGVLSERFALPREVMPTLGVADDGEIFLPLPLSAAARNNRGNEDYNILGKVRTGVTIAAAQAEMDTLTARLRRDHPEVYPPNGGLTFSLVPLLEQTVGQVRRSLLLLLGSVGLVLLIACANVGNLQLSRALARQKEIAVRTAIGASRLRIAAQLLTESLLLSLTGGAFGVLLAWVAVRWIHFLRPADLPRWREIGVNADVLLFTLAISIFAGVLFGLAPVLEAMRVNLAGAFKDSGLGAATLRGNNMRRILVAGEFALSVALLAGAGLLIRSLAQLQNVHPGFQPQGVLTFELSLIGKKYPDGNTVREAYRQLWERFDRLPGVTASGGVTSLPLSGFFAWGPITVEGRVPLPGERFINTDIRVVGGRYFEAMKIPLRGGRWFNEQDTPDKPRVIIIDEFMAQELWGGVDPIGKRIRRGDGGPDVPWLTVIGVVGRVKQYALATDGRIAMYLPQTQSPARSLYVTLRTNTDPGSLASAVKKEIRGLDPDLPMYRTQTMPERVTRSLAQQRFSMTLLTLFAAIALTLAAIGIYGVMSYLVAQRSREIGIRMAIGATPAAVQRLVLREGMAVAMAGGIAGMAAALALARVMRSLLFGVRPTDPVTFLAVALTLAAVAFMATYLPARRAARVDPMISLRAE